MIRIVCLLLVIVYATARPTIQAYQPYCHGSPPLEWRFVNNDFSIDNSGATVSMSWTIRGPEFVTTAILRQTIHFQAKRINDKGTYIRMFPVGPWNKVGNEWSASGTMHFPDLFPTDMTSAETSYDLTAKYSFKQGFCETFSFRSDGRGGGSMKPMSATTLPLQGRTSIRPLNFDATNIAAPTPEKSVSTLDIVEPLLDRIDIDPDTIAALEMPREVLNNENDTEASRGTAHDMLQVNVFLDKLQKILDDIDYVLQNPDDSITDFAGYSQRFMAHIGMLIKFYPKSLKLYERLLRSTFVVDPAATDSHDVPDDQDVLPLLVEDPSIDQDTNFESKVSENVSSNGNTTKDTEMLKNLQGAMAFLDRLQMIVDRLDLLDKQLQTSSDRLHAFVTSMEKSFTYMTMGYAIEAIRKRISDSRVTSQQSREQELQRIDIAQPFIDNVQPSSDNVQSFVDNVNDQQDPYLLLHSMD